MALGVSPPQAVRTKQHNSAARRVEEFFQHYTEVDSEIQEPAQIEQNINYFIDYRVDSEKNPTTTAPEFNSEIEYCDNAFSICNFDWAGWFRKKLVVR